MRFIWILTFIFFTSLGFSQEMTWKGRVLNSESNQSIGQASISSKSDNYGAISKNDGSFELRFRENEEIVFYVSHLNYKTSTIALKKDDFELVQEKGKQFYLLERDIELTPRVYELGQVQISSAPNPPDTVYGTEEYSIGDYAFIGANQMLLLVYEKEKRWKKEGEVNRSFYNDCRLVLLNEQRMELDVFSLEGEVCENFHTEYLGEIFLKTTVKYYHIKIENDLILLETIANEDFETLIKPVIDTVGDFVYVSSYSPDYPAFEYYVFNQLDSSYHTLHWVVDQPLMDLFRSEYKYLDGRGKLEAYRTELKTGIDKEIVAAYMTGFSSDAYYQSLYAPIFIHNDTILVFDHYEDKMYTFDSSNNIVDSTLISYHKTEKRKNWKDQMIQDEETGEVFAVFEKNSYSYLKAIDRKSGEASYPFKFFYKFAEKPKVKNGWVYYIYRPFESSQKKFLYRERLDI